MNTYAAIFVASLLALNAASHVAVLTTVWLPTTNNELGRIVLYTNIFGERNAEIALFYLIIIADFMALYVTMTNMGVKHEKGR